MDIGVKKGILKWCAEYVESSNLLFVCYTIGLICFVKWFGLGI